jgi:hypothetical protein
MGYAIHILFGFECISFAKGTTHNATFASQKFTHRELIWTINFKFGAHKVETTYIPSNCVYDFIDGEEQCSNANCKFICR